MAGSIPLGCGKCHACLTNRARLWSWRQFIEYLSCGSGAFCTLTYSEDYLPRDRQLCAAHVQLWLKRFRKFIYPHRVRYFLVGEYGEQSYRPHYHVNLFGVSFYSGFKNKPLVGILERTWGRGLVHTGEFNVRTAHYVTGYLSKSLRDRLSGRRFEVPEFTRMSRRPGLGYYGVSVLAGALSGIDSVSEGELPFVLRADGRRIPLGRYLRNHLIKELDIVSETEVEKDKASWESSSRLQCLYRADETIPSLKEVYLKSVEGALRKLEARSAIYQKVGDL